MVTVADSNMEVDMCPEPLCLTPLLYKGGRRWPRGSENSVGQQVQRPRLTQPDSERALHKPAGQGYILQRAGERGFVSSLQ